MTGDLREYISKLKKSKELKIIQKKVSTKFEIAGITAKADKSSALLFENIKHYFIIRFPQRAGALREFVADILGPDDDITHFEYTKKTNRYKGAAVVGLELKKAESIEAKSIVC